MPELETNRIITGDCFDVLPTLPDASVHAVVTDPPYALGDGFMGKEWDSFSDSKTYQKWCEKWAEKCRRVLKPGGHLLAFGGNTRHHRLFSGVEDAGFQIRDTLTWHYGSGFPKALDVSKAIDKAAGRSRRELASTLKRERKQAGMSRADVADAIDVSEASVRDWEEGRRRSADDDGVEWVFPTRERHERLADLFDKYPSPQDMDRADAGDDRRDDGTVLGLGLSGQEGKYTERSAAAREWDGFKTALKPATEFIVLARKPFEGTVAENVQEHGTGALNIDGCRIVTDDSLEGGATGPNPTMRTLPGDERTEAGKGMFANPQPVEPGDGRYPANVIFDGEAAKILDRAVGEQPASGRYPGRDRGPDDEDLYGDSRPGGEGDSEKLDGGGPSRYFKTTGREGEATADKRYPDEGGTDFSMKPGLRRHDEGGTSRFFYTSKANRAERTLDGRIENDHPTVKPQDLMEWLVKLVTAEDQIVLDPFAGSGTTAAACKSLNRQFVAIEMNERYADIARVRTGLTPEDPSIVRDDEGQAGLEAFGGDD